MAWTSNNPAIIMTQTCKKFAVMKPRVWKIFLGFNSWQLQILQPTTMLITGELRDLRNNKASTALTAVSLQIPVSGGKHNVLNPVFSLCMSDILDKVHSNEQKPIAVIFRTSRSGSDVRYSCHHNLSLFHFPYLRIRGVSVSSIHYIQSRRMYINRKQK